MKSLPGFQSVLQWGLIDKVEEEREIIQRVAQPEPIRRAGSMPNEKEKETRRKELKVTPKTKNRHHTSTMRKWHHRLDFLCVLAYNAG